MSAKHFHYSHVCDEDFDTEWTRISTIQDAQERNAALKDLGVYALEQAWNICLPLSNDYVFWRRNRTALYPCMERDETRAKIDSKR